MKSKLQDEGWGLASIGSNHGPSNQPGLSFLGQALILPRSPPQLRQRPWMAAQREMTQGIRRRALAGYAEWLYAHHAHTEKEDRR